MPPSAAAGARRLSFLRPRRGRSFAPLNGCLVVPDFLHLRLSRWRRARRRSRAVDRESCVDSNRRDSAHKGDVKPRMQRAQELSARCLQAQSRGLCLRAALYSVPCEARQKPRSMTGSRASRGANLSRGVREIRRRNSQQTRSLQVQSLPCTSRVRSGLLDSHRTVCSPLHSSWALRCPSRRRAGRPHPRL